MSTKTIREWKVQVLWGQIAVVSRGDPSSPRVLMFHGYMDSAATFSILLDHLPDSYYYVSFDLPGHGKSDPFPDGPLTSQADLIEPVRLVVDSLKWDSFVAIVHSMGITVATLYNAIYPGKIKKIAAIDPGPSIAVHYSTRYDRTYLSHQKYNKYYQVFGKLDKPKLFTYDKVVSWMAKNRNITEDQAKVLLSRSLVSVGNGMYKLSWDNKARYLSPLPVSEDILLYTMAIPVPTLVFVASEDNMTEESRLFATKLIKKWSVSSPNFFIIPVTGHHDVHITNPDVLAPHIKRFLDKVFDSKAKL